MSLFQNSVLNKYLKGLESEKISEAYQRFTSHFHNPTIQENIRNSKEEQYQGEFLIDLFVNVFGYVKNPAPDFNLTTELKNIKGSKKTDGAILKDKKALAVIELKGTNTTDLSKVETQAFGYKNNQPGCNYVITSNFEKLRFYIDNAVDFEEFNLFQLTKERFNILWLCLSSQYLLKDIPKKIKDESLTQEENVTKKLYKDYASFRNEIFDAIQKENTEYDKLTLFKKTQKLLDRFLFIFFAEDRLLLPPNSIRSIVNQWTDLKDKYDEYFPLYDRFKKYFGYMNTGYKGQQHDIFAYNGGLFAPDEILDNIKINDALLHKHTVTLSNYDFESEVSVNILGHIFEHSLNDIDEIQAEIQGVATEQSKTKRKKDGVFYTPKYITKYIVDNTVGKLCAEKKTELDIQEAEYEKERRGRQKATLKKLTQKLEDYRKWLLQITICDPACGSGAFLNQALEFLIAEHQYIDELQAKLFGDAMVLSEVENAILENNIYGVDINEESVDIAKLSLWLRTAQKGRKLTSLNSNIKCGNSLIDDVTVAGNKAFHWQKEFPEVFKEKDKKAYHITTALHDSRTSQRMIDYKVREKRNGGTNPLPNYNKLTAEEELLITKEIIAIAEENQLHIMAYNCCGDHIHLLLVCEEQEVPKIMQKIKAITARKVNIARGITTTRAHAKAIDAPEQTSTTMEQAKAIDAVEQASTTMEQTTDIDAPEQASTTMEQTIDIDAVEQAYTTMEQTTDIDAVEQTSTTMEHAPLPLPRGKKQHSLWTQKYGCKDIKDDNQLHNTINYIQTNRTKHQLPQNKALQTLLNNPILNQDYDTVFATDYTGGFDVIIGNPPYVRQELFKEIKPYLQEHYKCYNSVADLYTYFIEQGINLMNENGLFSFILPNKFLKATYGKSIRKVIKEKSNLELLLDFDDYPVFADATTYPIIYVVNKKTDFSQDSFMYAEINKRDNTVDPINLLESKKHKVPFASLTEDMWNFIDTTSFEILNKIENNSTELGKVVDKKIFRGLTTGRNEAFVIDGEKRKELITKNSKNSERIKVLATGKEVKRNTFDFQDRYLLFTGFNDDIPKEYPDIQEELAKYKEALIKRYDQGENYWNLRACAYYEEMQQPKIIYPRINNKGNFYFDEKGDVFLLDNNFFISTDSKALLALLNSKLVYFYLKNVCTTLQGGFYDFRRDKITTIPVNNNFNSIEKDISVLADNLIDFTDQSNKSEINFIYLLKSKFGINTISKKLQNWHELEFSEFLKELEKARKKEAKTANKEFQPLALSEEAEWMQYFNEQKQKAVKLKTEIDKTDKEIDAMVYQLYGLTDDEIATVEESTT